MATVKSVKKIGFAPVYNMEVKDYHNFSVNGGLIVHNCMDAARYANNHFSKTCGYWYGTPRAEKKGF